MRVPDPSPPKASPRRSVCAPTATTFSFYRRPGNRSNSMKRRKLLSLAAGLALALGPVLASAQDADTLSISGTFHMGALQGTVGTDLAAVFAKSNEQWWSLTLHGVTYSHDYLVYDWIDE